MQTPFPAFRWPRFLVSFIAAPILVTLLTFWAFIPIYALFFGGPFYLLAGLPLAAWYLHRPNPRSIVLILIALLASLLQVPVYALWAFLSGDRGIVDALPAFIMMGALFALLWTGAFLLLYRLLARAENPTPAKEPDHV